MAADVISCYASACLCIYHFVANSPIRNPSFGFLVTLAFSAQYYYQSYILTTLTMK